MHAEHAELISALRSENHRLTVANAELVTYRAIIKGQDELLKNAQRIIDKQQATLEEQMRLLFEMSAKLEEAGKCP